MVTCIFAWSWIRCSSRWCVTLLCCDNIMLGEGPFPGQCSVKIVINWCWFDLRSASPHLQQLSLVELLWMCICSLNSSLSVSFWFYEGLAQKSQASLDFEFRIFKQAWIWQLWGSDWNSWSCWMVLKALSETAENNFGCLFPLLDHTDHQPLPWRFNIPKHAISVY